MEAEDVIHVRLHLTAIIGEAVITGMSLPRLQIGQIVARDMLVAHMNTMMVVIPHHILQGTVEAGIQGTTDHQTGKNSKSTSKICSAYLFFGTFLY